MDRWEMVKGVCLNLQPKPNNLVLGPETLLVAGSATIAEEFCGIHLQLNSNTFFQINTPQAERIVNVLCDWLLIEIGEGTVVDAYCGIGTISLPLAAKGFDVIGLELHQGSVDQALLNAMRNNLSDQCRFRAGDVVDLLEQAGPRLDQIMIPKVGCAEDVYAVDALVSAIETAKGRKKRIAFGRSMNLCQMHDIGLGLKGLYVFNRQVLGLHRFKVGRGLNRG